MTPQPLGHSPENRRILALRAAQLLDSPSEEVFDRLTALAAKALRVPVSLISLVDSDRQFFKSQVGLPQPWASARETPLTHSFCQHVAATAEPLLVTDARSNPLVADNLAVRDLNVIAYAGVPMINSKGYCFGSLCAIDSKPREWNPEEVELLHSLAAQAMTEIELRHKGNALRDDIAGMNASDANRQTNLRSTVHDLRTPLNSLMMNLEVIKSSLAISDEVKEWIELSGRSAEALRLLVDDLIDNEALSLRGGEALSLAPCDPLAFSLIAYDQVRGLATQKGLALTRVVEPDLPLLILDEAKVVRVLVNLLGNAIKFTPKGGSVRLEVRYLRSSEELEMSVTDTGIGFSTAHTPTIFTKGGMLDGAAPTRKSTGWGLEFSKRVVEAHKGTIEVQSAPGAGSTFTVRLPAKIVE